MAAYLICRKERQDLETMVFSAGPNSSEEAVLLFTNPDAAQQFIDEAGWSAEWTVATVDAIPLLHWFLKAHEDGIQHVAVDPLWNDHAAGKRLSTLSIEGQLEHAAAHIMKVANPDF
jgi:hypothetical protein